MLEDGHSMIVEGMECITLGHGLKNDVVASHDYLGTSAIIEDLKLMEGWSNGSVEVGGFQRHPTSLRITKLLQSAPQTAE